MNKAEFPPQLDEEIESFEGLPVDTEKAKEEALKAEEKERALEAQAAALRIEQEEAQIQEIKQSIQNQTPSPEDRFEDNRAPEEKQKITPKPKSGFMKRWVAILGAMGIMAGGAAKAGNLETNPNDSTKNKTEQFKYIEANKEVGGLTYKGAFSVPSDDKEYDYFFIGLDGNNADENKIGHMKQAIKELGFEAASAQDLQSIFTKNQKILTEKIGYGMAIDTARLESDDTRDPNVNDTVGADAVESFTTFNPTGQINRYEHNMIGKEYNYGEYAILVKVKKQKEDTVQMPGADFAQTNK